MAHILAYGPRDASPEDPDRRRRSAHFFSRCGADKERAILCELHPSLGLGLVFYGLLVTSKCCAMSLFERG